MLWRVVREKKRESVNGYAKFGQSGGGHDKSSFMMMMAMCVYYFFLSLGVTYVCAHTYESPTGSLQLLLYAPALDLFSFSFVIVYAYPYSPYASFVLP